MSAKHTPRPWKAVAKANPDQSEGTHFIMCQIGALGYWRGAKPYHNDSQWVMGEADAHLIAAAPDLLEALENLLAAQIDPLGIKAADACKAACAAIAKAKGEA